MRKYRLFMGAVTLLLIAGSITGISPPVAADSSGFCTVDGEYEICTDKDDYAPGETVHISGSGFAAGTGLSVKVTRPDGSVVTGDGSFAPWPTAYDTVITNTEGGFRYDYVLNGIEGEYLIEVLDSSGTVLATHTFTDSRTITSVTLNGASSVTVVPGATISATVHLTSTSGDDWESTSWRIGTGTFNCKDTPDHEPWSGTHSYPETFDITAPMTPGTYNADFVAYSNDSCSSGASSTFTLTNAVVVECTQHSECDDSNVCTDDTCVGGSCVYTNNTASCDDGLFCTATDTCSGGTCLGSGDPCQEGEVCMEGTDTCVGGPCVVYDFSNDAGTTHHAYGTYSDSWSNDLNGHRTHAEFDTEVDDVVSDAYDDLASSDATGGDSDPNRYQNPDEGNNDESTMTCEFYISEDRNDVTYLDVLWEGYGDGNRHMELYIWNYDQSNWGDLNGNVGENNFIDDGTANDTDMILQGSTIANITDYIDTDGEITLLIYMDSDDQRSYHDYVSVTVCSEPECENHGDCDDSNVCTDDACVGGSCVYTNNTASCDDGLFCTTGETCTQGACSGGSPTDCSAEGDQCNDGVCDEDADACVKQSANEGNFCDDGLFCTATDTCSGGTCVGSGDPCQEGEVCNEETDTCETPPLCVVYDFSSGAGTTHHAYGTYSDSWSGDLNGHRTDSEFDTEVTSIASDAYTDMAYSDATGGDSDPNRYQNPDEGYNDESTMTCEFYISEDPNGVTQLDVLWEGYGDGNRHMELYIWNYSQSNWGDLNGNVGENNFIDDGTANDTDMVLQGSTTSSITNYIDTDGEITLLIYMDSSSEDSRHDYVSVTVCSEPECENDGDCDDSNVCTDDACVGGSCVYTNNTASCDDGLFCNGTETCGGGTCQGGTDPCPGQLCDESADACVDCLENLDCEQCEKCQDGACVPDTAQNGNGCDDGDPCTENDVCANGVCAGTPIATDENVAVQLAMIVDGSGSIQSGNWAIIVGGLADSANDVQTGTGCIPRDGTVELTVVQFGDAKAQLEVGPVVITSGNAAAVATQIRNISQLGGYTPMACGIYLAADVLRDDNAPPQYHDPCWSFNPQVKQAINLVTDGVPNRCCPNEQQNKYEAWDCKDSGSCSDDGCAEADASVLAARNYAITTLGMTSDQDEIDVEGIGITDTNRDWLKNNIIFPATSYSSPPGAWPPPGPGWVRVVANATEFANTICEKFAVVLKGTIIVEKQTFPDGATDTFTFTGDASGTIGDGQQIPVADLSPGQYTVTESVIPAGWNLTAIDFSDTNSTGNLVTATATINLEAGETVTVTFTNTTEECQDMQTLDPNWQKTSNYTVDDQIAPPTLPACSDNETWTWTTPVWNGPQHQQECYQKIADEDWLGLPHDPNNPDYWADWLHHGRNCGDSEGEQFTHRWFRTQFDLSDYSELTRVKLVNKYTDSDHPGDMLSINDDLYVYVNGVLVASGGTATVPSGCLNNKPVPGVGGFPSNFKAASRASKTGDVWDFAPEMDGWYIEGGLDLDTSAFTLGMNYICILTDEYCECGGLEHPVFQVTGCLCTVTADAGDDETVCVDANLGLNGNPSDGSTPYSHSWTGDTGPLSATNVVDPTFNSNTPGTYSLTYTVTDSEDCQASDSMTVTVNAKPDCTITAPQAVSANSTGNTASVPDAGASATYNWTVTGGNITGGQGTKSITWNAGSTSPVTIGVSITNANDCQCSSSTEVTVRGCSISGHKYRCDVSDNCTDEGLEGWTITLHWPGGGTTDNITDSNGYYEFTGLPDGTYTVTETLKPGWENCTPTSYDITLCNCQQVVVSDNNTMVTAGNSTPPDHAAVYAWEHSAWAATKSTFSCGAEWIWESYRPVNYVAGDVVEFQRTFYIPGNPTNGSLHITCDNGYEVYVNGTFAGSAQVHDAGDPLKEWETSDLTEPYVNSSGWDSVETYNQGVDFSLQHGTNTLVIKAANEYMGDLDGQADGTVDSNPAGLIFELFYDSDVNFCNRELGTITVVKDADPADGTDFEFSSDLGANFFLKDGQSQPFNNLTWGDYDVTEIVPAGWTLDNINCTGGDSTPIADGVTVHLDPGEDITVTFTNTLQPGSITIIKEVVGEEPDSEWEFTGDLNFNLPAMGGNKTSDNLTPGVYTITETIKPGYTPSVNCSNCDNCTTTDNSVTIDLGPGDDVTCTFTNTKQLCSLSGYKYRCDVSGNCTQEGLGDWTINLTGPVSATTTTDNTTGHYEFTGLLDGTYTVTETLKPGWENCTPTSYEITLYECHFVVASDNSTLVTIGNGATPHPAVYAWEYKLSDPNPPDPNNSDWDKAVSSTHVFSNYADWIWESYRPVNYVAGDVVEFQRTFYIPGNPTNGTLYITCDNGYEVYVNGTFVDSAQVHDTVTPPQDWETSDLTEKYVNSQGWQSVETYNVSSLLQSGTNILVIKAANEEMSKASGDHSEDGTVDLNPAGLIFELFYDSDVNFCNRQLGSITVVKEVEGTAPSDNWTFAGDLGAFQLPPGGGSKTFTNQGDGNYTITETTKTGYTPSVSVAPGGESGTDSVSFDLSPGENATVTFTNTPDKGSITVVKVVEGTAPSDNWTFAGDLGAFQLPPGGGSKTFTNQGDGNYTITETTKTGYTPSVSVAPGGESGTNSVSFDLSPGENATVTFTNTRQESSIRIVKDAVPDDYQKFQFTSPELGPFELDDDNVLDNYIEFTGLDSGTYNVTELIPADWLLKSIVIVDPDGGSSVDLSAAKATIDLDPGESVTVTFTNQKRGSIIITKTPDRGLAYVGDIITYTYVITNTSQVTTDNLTLIDDMLGNVDLGGVTSLGPGQSITVTKDYTVTAADLANPITNIATVRGTYPVDNPVSDNATAIVVPGAGGGVGSPSVDFAASACPLTLTVNVLGNETTVTMTIDGVLCRDCVALGPQGRTGWEAKEGTRLTLANNKVPRLIKITLAGSPPPPSNAAIAGHMYNVNAYASRHGSRPSLITISPQSMIVLGYDQDKLPDNTTAVLIAYYDEQAGKWVDLETAGYVAGGEEVANTLTSQVTHFTTFAVLAKLAGTTPAKFDTSNLIVNPAQAAPNQAITASVNVANSGGTTGDYRLEIRVDGVASGTKKITLAPGASQAVNFTITEDTAGKHRVEVARLTAEFEVTAQQQYGANLWLIGGILGAVLVILAIAWVTWTRRRVAG